MSMSRLGRTLLPRVPGRNSPQGLLRPLASASSALLRRASAGQVPEPAEPSPPSLRAASIRSRA